MTHLGKIHGSLVNGRSSIKIDSMLILQVIY